MDVFAAECAVHGHDLRLTSERAHSVSLPGQAGKLHIHFPVLPYPSAGQACVRGMRGCDTHRGARTACGVRMNALASSQAPHHSSPCKHADSFALLLVLSKPKHRFGFGRRNGGAAWSFPACPGSGMERVRLDDIRFFILPYPAAGRACVREMRAGPIVPSQFYRQRQSLGVSKGGPTSPFGVLSLRCYRVSRRNGRTSLRRRASAPSPHPLPRFSFTNPKHRFGFERKNEEADMEFSASAGNEMQRVHSDVGKKWGNKLAPRCAPQVKLRLGFGRDAAQKDRASHLACPVCICFCVISAGCSAHSA